MGGGGRLNPSGYSLLDFQHKVARKVVDAISKLNDDDDSCFEDWQDLLANYPWRREKALKDQGGVSEYCQRRLYDMRQSLKSGSPSLIYAIGRPTDKVSPSKFGRIGLQLLTLLRYAHDASATDQVNWSSEQWDALEFSQVAHKQTFNHAAAFSWINSLLDSSRRWRRSVSEDDVIYQEGETSLDLVMGLLDRAFDKPRPNSEYIHTSQTHRQVWLELQSEVFMYYRTVLALSASLLKAHVLSSWVLFGTEEFIRICEDIVQRRSDIPYIWLRAYLWKVP